MARISLAEADPASSPSRATSILGLLVLKEGSVPPKTAPPWLFAAIGASITLFLAGLLASLGAFGTPSNGRSLHLSPPLIAGVLIAGVIGRGLAVLIQAEAACGLAGPSSKERGRRQTIVLSCLVAQVPTAVRDGLLGIGAFAGVLDTPTVVRLAGSPFDPFLLWSCLVFCRAVRVSFPQLTPSARRGLYAGFCGYAYVLKFVTFGLGSLA